MPNLLAPEPSSYWIVRHVDGAYLTRLDEQEPPAWRPSIVHVIFFADEDAADRAASVYGGELQPVPTM
jgi:hypothetical protein